MTVVVSKAASFLARRCSTARFGAAQRGYASTRIRSISEPEVKALFTKWNDALATLQGGGMFCSGRGVTVSDTPRADTSSIEAYFLSGRMNSSPRNPGAPFSDRGSASGTAIFGKRDLRVRATGETVKARYTFVYAKDFHTPCER